MNKKILRAREQLNIIIEQLAALTEEADEAHIDAIVSETPLARDRDKHAQRHVVALQKEADAARAKIAKLKRLQDELIGQAVILPEELDR